MLSHDDLFLRNGEANETTIDACSSGYFDLLRGRFFVAANTWSARCLDILVTKRCQVEGDVSRQVDATQRSFLQLLFVVQSCALAYLQQLCLGEGVRFR